MENITWDASGFTTDVKSDVFATTAAANDRDFLATKSPSLSVVVYVVNTTTSAIIHPEDTRS